MERADAVCVRRLRLSDVPTVAELHRRAFPNFFLTSLGDKFLLEFYAGVSEDRAGICYVAEVEGDIGGFVAGSSHGQSTYRRLVKARFYPLALAAAPAMLKRPSIALRLLRTFSARTSAPPRPHTAELMSIAVDPAQQGRALGQALVRGFVTAAAAEGAERISLTTDGKDNARVNEFYTQQGFALRTTFTTPEGRLMNEYEMAIPSGYGALESVLGLSAQIGYGVPATMEDE